MEACHCGMCRTWGGGPLMSTPCGSEVAFEGKEHIAVYESSAWAERGFCKVCGSHLFFRLKATRQHYIPVGLFDQQGSFTFELQGCIDRKPSFYAFANKTRNLTEAQFMGEDGQP
ncbi:GFA family protein [Halomonas sp. CS7]|uniref:GFA family protein n=1 Tax=Halomonas pelophila TaxID=3151122 RepID=A0ABV1NA41_9GAMM